MGNLFGGGAPKAPDPWETAQAQAGLNRTTAITQQELNMVNQNNPYGSVSYTQTGTSANGTPQYTQNTTFSPGQQAIFDASQGAQTNLAQLAQRQSSALGQQLSQPMPGAGVPSLVGNPNLQTNLGLQTSYAGADDFSADRRRVEDALWQRTAGDRSANDASLRTTLANKGIQEGTAAWDAEMARMGAQNTDARLATLLAGGQEQSRLVGLSRDAAMFGNDARTTQGAFGNAASLAGAQFQNQARGQGLQEGYTARNQGINEVMALMGGAQVANPGQQSAASPQAQVGGVDYTGLVNQQYQAQNQNYQAKMGGIGGLLGMGAQMFFSDRRLKTDIEHLGATPGGTPVYSYRYIWGGPTHIGVMAQDVPDAATMHESGFLMVDYGKVH